ncbi:MAG: FHA domain-containing protein [Myxococcales bacterium]|nr:FHA domain-containing protein [Myxococcales bacterium]
MARYRLRLLLQEFDLPQGETVLGRSPECQVTIDDPLVSREHAKIIVQDDTVVCRDSAVATAARSTVCPCAARSHSTTATASASATRRSSSPRWSCRDAPGARPAASATARSARPLTWPRPRSARTAAMPRAPRTR